MNRRISNIVICLLIILPCSLMAAKKSDKDIDVGEKTSVAKKADRTETKPEQKSTTVTKPVQPAKVEADNKKGTTSIIDITPIVPIPTNDINPVLNSPEAGEQINWQVFSGGVTNAISTSYHLEGTLGQIAVGLAVSTSYSLNQGFWQDFGGGPTTCCGQFASGFTGNTTCDIEGKRNLADITSLIDHVYISKDDLCCNENGNTNGDGDGKRNLADITILIDHVYISKDQTSACL